MFYMGLTDLTGSYNDLTAFLRACGDGRGARLSTVYITGALSQIASRRHLGEYLGDISANISARSRLVAQPLFGVAERA